MACRWRAGIRVANTTFRRNFPEIAADLASQAASRQQAPPPPSRHDQLQELSARLRQDNRQLRDQLELAAAVIQRITLENQRLREQLEAASNITTLASKTMRPRRL
jgi:argininosuccinate lyase